MTDLIGKGPACTEEATLSDAYLTQQLGLSNAGPLSFTWPSAWRRHLVNACKQGCWYCRHAKEHNTQPRI